MCEVLCGRVWPAVANTGIYFRSLRLGYFEGIDSGRGIRHFGLTHRRRGDLGSRESPAPLTTCCGLLPTPAPKPVSVPARDSGWKALAALGIIAGAIRNTSVPDAGSDLSMISAR